MSTRKPQHMTPTLNGDGRSRLTHKLRDLHGSKPCECTRATARKLIDMFQLTGRSSHSGQGGLLWVVLEWAAQNEVAVRVLVSVGNGGHPLGYYVERLPAPAPHVVERQA